MKTISVVLLLAVIRSAAADEFDLKVEDGFVANVWGFCQGAYKAPLSGGWVDANASNYTDEVAAALLDGTCHKGLMAEASYSLFPKSACTATDASKNTCNCLGVPQCNRGMGCKFDCSCKVQQNETLKNFLTSLTLKPTFVGRLKFDDGNDFDVSCSLPSPSDQQYIHGYHVKILGHGPRDRRCDKSEPPNMHSSYTCIVELEQGEKALENGDVFVQRYTFQDSSALRLQISQLVLLGVSILFAVLC